MFFISFVSFFRIWNPFGVYYSVLNFTDSGYNKGMSYPVNLNPWNSKGKHLRFHLSFVRKSSLKQLNCAVLSGLSSDFTARSILNFFTRWVKKFWSFLTGNSELSERNKRLSNGYKLNFRTKQCEMSIRFPNEFHGSRVKYTWIRETQKKTIFDFILPLFVNSPWNCWIMRYRPVRVRIFERDYSWISSPNGWRNSVALSMWN